MPLFGLIKKSKKKTKDQQSTDDDLVDEHHSVHSTASSATGASGGAAKKTTSNTTAPSKKFSKVKSSASSNLTPVRTISQKTPNPFTQPVDIPKSAGLAPEVDTRMYSASPFSSTPQPTAVAQPASPQPQQLQNVVTGQYNAPPTPPSTAQSGSIDDKLDSLSPSIASTTTGYPNDQLRQPQPVYPINTSTADATISSSSGLMTPLSSASERFVPSRYPNPNVNTNAIRPTKGKYSIVDFSIQRTLGTGSFGRVHLVQSRHNSRFYAIKVSFYLLQRADNRSLKSSKLSK